MKILKQILAVMLFVFIFLAVGITGTYLLINNSTLMAVLVKGIESATEIQISYKKPVLIERTLSPRITINDLTIEETNTRLQLHSSLFQLQINLPAMDIKQLTVTVEPNTDKLICTLGTRFGEQTINIVTTLPPIQTILKQQRMPFSANVMDPSFHFSLKGLIDFSSSPPTIEADLQGEVPDLGQIASITGNVPFSGELESQARISGTFDQLRLENLSAVWKKHQHIDLQLKGRIDDLVALTGFDLELNGWLENPYFLTTVLPENMGPLKRIDLSTEISGTYPDLGFKKCRLNIKTVNDLALNVAGQLGLAVTGQFDDVDDINTLSLNATMTARDLQGIGSMLNQEWPAMGPVKLNSSITKKDDGIQCETMATAGETQINATTHIISRKGTPYINSKIKVQNMFFPDPLETKNTPGNDKSSKALSFFSRKPLSLDWMKKVDMDLLIDISSFEKERINLESAKFRINLESGRLSMDSARLAYPKGNIKLNLRIELKKDLSIRIKASCKGINPWQTVPGQEKNISTFIVEWQIIASSRASSPQMPLSLIPKTLPLPEKGPLILLKNRWRMFFYQKGNQG